MHWFSHKKSCKNLVIQYERELKIQREFERQQKEAEAKKIIEREVKEELQPHNVGNGIQFLMFHVYNIYNFLCIIFALLHFFILRSIFSIPK